MSGEHEGNPELGPRQVAQAISDDLALKREDQALRRAELEHRMRQDRRTSFPPWGTALVALLTTTATATASGLWNLKLKQREQEFQIILRATQDRTPEEAVKNLLFFVDIGYLPDPRDRIRKRATPESVPVLTTGGSVNPILERVANEPATNGSTAASAELVIRNHVLYTGSKPVSIVATPSVGKMAPPRFIVLHYTATPTLQAATTALSDQQRQASAHVIIGRAGEIVQMAPFDFATRHAGRSRWQDVDNLNSHSIGIDLVNWGRLTRNGSAWAPAFGTQIVAAADVQTISDSTGNVTGWQKFPDAQIDALMRVLQVVKRQYPTIEEVVAHSEVALPAGVKTDPGPAFPLERVRQAFRQLR